MSETFIRSSPGINNYHHFTYADFTVIIEGKVDEPENSRFDEIYYRNLLKNIYPDKVFAIKCYGNKKNVIDFFNRIENPLDAKTICIIDKDLEGIHYSKLSKIGLITSYFYSWENELWCENLVLEIIDDLMPNFIHDHTHIKKEYNDIKNCLFYLSRLDACLQLNAENLFPKKRKGLNYHYPRFSLSEIKRLTNIFKSKSSSYFDICNELLKNSKPINRDMIIQGHLLDHITHYYISGYYQNATSDKKPSFQILKGLAISKFKNFLNRRDEITENYKNQLDLIISK